MALEHDRTVIAAGRSAAAAPRRPVNASPWLDGADRCDTASMAVHVHRVVVRGQFADLTPQQRHALLAEADDHSIFRSSFTEWGTFTYEPNLVAFNFRYEVRLDDEVDEPTDPVAVGMAKATASLADWGLGSKHLRGHAADMSAIWPS